MEFAEILNIIQVNMGNTSLWIGLVTVLVFSYGRFNETRKDYMELDPPIFLRNFTTKFRYLFASFTYAGTYAVIYVLLICLGSMPELQGFLKDWIGSVPGINDTRIGTPSWAALALTAVLPTFRPFASLDQSLRRFLQEFASIPLKAQSIAKKLLTELEAKVEVTTDRQELVYSTLQSLVKELRQLKRLRAADAYGKFMGWPAPSKGARMALHNPMEETDHDNRDTWIGSRQKLDSHGGFG